MSSMYEHRSPDGSVRITECHSGGRTYGDILLVDTKKHEIAQIIKFNGENDTNFQHYIRRCTK